MEQFLETAFQGLVAVAMQGGEEQDPSDEGGQRVTTELGIEQRLGRLDVHDKDEHSHHGDLGEYLDQKQPIKGADFLFSKEMVEVELVETVDEGHQEHEPAVAFRDDGMIEARE